MPFRAQLRPLDEHSKKNYLKKIGTLYCIVLVFVLYLQYKSSNQQTDV